MTDATGMGEISKFQVSTNRSGRKRTIKVWVYDSLKDLRQDADKWNKLIRDEEQDNSHILGVAHRNERIRVEDDYSHPDIGMIRLHRQHLRTGIISHEVAHIAVWIYELDIKKPLTTDDIENEETFCHILGELNARLVNKLYEKQLFPPKKEQL